MSAQGLNFEDGLLVPIFEFYRNNPPPSVIMDELVAQEKTPPPSPKKVSKSPGKKDLLEMAIDGLELSPIEMQVFSPVLSPITPLKKTPEELRRVLADLGNNQNQPLIQPLIQPHVFKVPQVPTQKKRTITSIQPRELVCNECGRSFAKQGYLTRHLELHYENIPNVCHICIRRVKPENFQKHMSKHGIAIGLRETRFSSN